MFIHYKYMSYILNCSHNSLFIFCTCWSSSQKKTPSKFNILDEIVEIKQLLHDILINMGSTCILAVWVGSAHPKLMVAGARQAGQTVLSGLTKIQGDRNVAVLI